MSAAYLQRRVIFLLVAVVGLACPSLAAPKFLADVQAFTNDREQW
jgi:hypothetical protein